MGRCGRTSGAPGECAGTTRTRSSPVRIPVLIDGSGVPRHRGPFRNQDHTILWSVAPWPRRNVGDRITPTSLSTSGAIPVRCGTSVQRVGQRLEQDDDGGRVRDAVPGDGLALAHLDGEVVGGEGAEGVLVRAVVAEIDR